MPSLNWQAELQDMPRVQKLVHLAARMDKQDVNTLSLLNARQKRKAYEDSLNELAKLAGCDRHAVSSMDTLRLMKEQANAEAEGVINTYNYHLAKEIQNIRQGAPKANRHVYASRLRTWHNDYMNWKSAQIALHNNIEWNSIARAEFVKYNDVQGTVELEPKTNAVCDICKYWVARGRVPIDEARRVMEDWPPHVNCIHTWKMNLVGAVNCDELWLGIEPSARKELEAQESEVDDAIPEHA